MIARKKIGFLGTIRIATAIGLVVIVGCFIIGEIGISIPKADYTTTPLTLSEFESRFPHDIQLPKTATNLFYASSQCGFTGFVRLYRFDAPVADCLAYGRQLLLKNDPTKKPEMPRMKSHPDGVSRDFLGGMGLSKVNWFDVEAMQSGFEGRREPSTQTAQPGMSFWIDADRGRFYFYSSD
ncbi:MAG: hypothetical protein ABFC96_11365 [Thermoguttaceae bacterium]